MSKENKSTAISPNLLSVLLIILGGSLFVGQSPFNDSRPNKASLSQLQQAGFKSDVDARLWQDPFEAIANQNLNSQGYQQFKDQKELIKTLQSHLEDIPDGRQIVIATLMPNGRYQEDVETRRRIRYAVLSGLIGNSKQEYGPSDEEHIGYVNYLLNKSSTLIAFEHLVWKAQPMARSPEAEKHPPILLLYLDSKAFGYEPLKDLFKNLRKLYEKNNKLELNVLGPATSDDLQAMASEALKVGKPKDAPLFRMYSPRATVDEGKLMYGNQAATAHQPSNLAEHFKNHLSFLRTTATDSQLAGALSQELELRGVRIGDQAELAKPTKHVVLISETESLYAYHIGTTFADALVETAMNGKHSFGACRDPMISTADCTNYLQKYVHQYTYFRGLDGKTLRGQSSTSTGNKSGNNDTNSAAEASKAMEHADGDSQFDYMRRLTDRVEELEQELEDHDQAIGAIGILGSDVYDKLLVLQALHAKFPDVWYFTNVMDARLLHPEQNEWARNLIVVSSFGLQLPPALQTRIPPFRDSYQTAYFLAAQMALWDSNHEPSEATGAATGCDTTTRQQLLDSEVFNQPALHEIGRSKAFPLNTDTGKTDRQKCDALGPMETLIQSGGDLSDTAPTPDSAAAQPFSRFPRLTLKILIGAFVLIGLGLYFRRKIKIATAAKLPVKAAVLRRQRVWLLIAFAIGCGLAALVLNTPQTEPLALIEGVSMWSTEAIRFAALVVTVYWVIETAKFPLLLWEQLNFSGKFGVSADNRCYAHDRYLDRRLKRNMHVRRISILTFLAWILSFVVILSLGVPFTPYRGPFVYYLDLILLKAILVPAFLFLMISVTEAAQAIIQFIRTIPRAAPWPASMTKEYSDTLNIDAAYLQDWVTIRLVGDMTQQTSRLISYPLFAAALMVLARMSYFDNWHTPPGLLIVIGVCIAYLFYCDFRLKALADETEQNAMKNLRRLSIANHGNVKDSSLAGKLTSLSELAERYAEGTYKPFVQRPIFQGMLLIIVAAAIGYTDYLSIMMKVLG
ncbi:hypothetical protein QLH52_03980 [Methylomonas sp. OY6]|uniref:Uncharacterized protein n=1 Tax=Methylomonas defluvii TaxID=3045149 RepID=A0ABU4UAI3_9GAMM|nr:hypothetical protein [Methylomonas sp. OY6]MDX8126426.1 hypothetical protein [Methylomonas sp. OY6]